MPQAELIAAYREARRPRFSPYNERRAYYTIARHALAYARQALHAKAVRARWDDMGGYICADYEAPASPDDGHVWQAGLVRIVCYADEYYELGDLLDDSFEPRHNSEIKPEILEREREAELERISRDGVWGYVAQFWDGADWQDLDGIWGFIGADFDASGYDTNLMQSALDELEAHQEQEARALEASRPDMYGSAA